MGALYPPVAELIHIDRRHGDGAVAVHVDAQISLGGNVCRDAAIFREATELDKRRLRRPAIVGDFARIEGLAAHGDTRDGLKHISERIARRAVQRHVTRCTARRHRAEDVRTVAGDRAVNVVVRSSRAVARNDRVFDCHRLGVVGADAEAAAFTRRIIAGNR